MIYFDTSYLVRLYYQDPGADAAERTSIAPKERNFKHVAINPGTRWQRRWLGSIGRVAAGRWERPLEPIGAKKFTL